MDRPSGKALVAVLAAVGASTGAGAAVVWHVAVAGPPNVGVTYIRPSWFPITLYLVAAGVVTGLVVASFLVDSGLRIVQDRQRSRAHLFALLIVIGAALGAGSALAWTHWPPQRSEPRSSATYLNTLMFVDWGDEVSTSASDFGWTSLDPSVSETYSSDTSYVTRSRPQSTFSPTISNPWSVFPIGGVVIAALAALTLSLRDYRLTVVSRSDQDAV
ncbi:hypothetical protein [Rhodococcoides yunnanense]|uniref:Uncharacterized protein n=1 Tax=Rhodococcoides yunnanense TaxID=278209 RepID=A0ABU4B937_9NOCA|nr:hypothetical protein [Rhodococcus yunnanensis]MDV6260703.1 hypothetical protein [Rhodococcus yunnanensis]